METRQFIPSSPPRKSWKWSGRGRQGARAGGGAPTSAAATRFPGTCLKGFGCGDLSRSRRGEPELARQGGCHRRGAGACGFRGVTSTLRLPRAGMRLLTRWQAFRDRSCRESVPGALRASLPLIPGSRAGAIVEVRGVRPGEHYWERGEE